MILKNKYGLGCLIQFYEVEMFIEFVDGILNMIKDIENKENIIIDFCFNTTQFFETIDINKITREKIIEKYNTQKNRLTSVGLTVNDKILYDENEKFPYNIAQYRRDFNHKYCEMVDFLLWLETDSFFPQETFHIIESISEHIEKNNENRRYTIVFAYRKMWGTDWKLLEHPEFENEQFQDNDEWTLKNIASEKCYMSIEQMNEINKKSVKYDIRITDEPKFDGSCLVISSEMVKCGVNIPHALLCSGEDTSFGWSAKKILGKNYTQYIIKNILRVHNRRRSKKRLYIKGENNEMGFCGSTDKGLWWSMLVDMSKANLNNLDNPNFKFHTWENYFEKVQGVIK